MVRGSIDELAIPRHSIFCAQRQTVRGVWTGELSDLGLQPQARTHGAGMASMMVIQPWECFARFRKVRHIHTQMRTTEEKQKTGCTDERWILTLAHFGCRLCEHWDVAALRLPRWVLFVAKGIQLVSQQCELSSDTQTAWLDTQGRLIHKNTYTDPRFRFLHRYSVTSGQIYDSITIYGPFVVVVFEQHRSL